MADMGRLKEFLNAGEVSGDLAADRQNDVADHQAGGRRRRVGFDAEDDHAGGMRDRLQADAEVAARDSAIGFHCRNEAIEVGGWDDDGCATYEATCDQT